MTKLTKHAKVSLKIVYSPKKKILKHCAIPKLKFKT